MSSYQVPEGTTTVPFALQVDQLNVNYGTLPVLWDISMAIPPHQMVGLLGPNGAGKSTLLKTILGFTAPASGKISLLGQTRTAVGSELVYVPQKDQLDWSFPISIEEFVLMGCYGRKRLFSRPSKEDRLAAEVSLQQVGLESLGGRQIGQLSGGQQQRAIIARALLQGGSLLFFDEPFRGIDATTECDLVALFKRLTLEGKTLFIVHHDLHTAPHYFSWLIFLNMRLICSAPTQEAFTQEIIYQTYGKTYALLEEAYRLRQQSHKGLAL